MKTVDVVVVGGGIVGTVLAKGLTEQAGLSTVLIDATSPSENPTAKGDFNPFTDTRVIALARRTVSELADLGIAVDDLAKHLHGERPPAIKSIEVSDKGHFGLVDLKSDDFHIDAFGQVVALSALTRLALDASSEYDYLAPATVTAVSQTQKSIEVTLDNGEVISTKLVILADGGRSPLAQHLGITKTTRDYQQTAIVFNVHTQLPHHNKAYERFTASGPLAFLPFDSEIGGTHAQGNGFSVVWTVAHCDAQRLMDMNDKVFLNALQQAFGYRQGTVLRVSERASYPLALTTANAVVAHRAVVVGNAAQALHPIAGQGFNLGLRDICALINVVRQAKNNATNDDFDPGAFAITHEYATQRQRDRDKTVFLTDCLVRAFSNNVLPFVLGRNLGLLAFGLIPGVKNAFVKQTTGYGEGTADLITRDRKNYATR